MGVASPHPPPRSDVAQIRRSRSAYGVVAAVAIGLGLASRRFGDALPDVVRLYAGDTLWAATAYFVAATVLPRTRIVRLAIGALTFAFAVEASQLYHAPWIDRVRSTRLGALVLGYGFLWSDLACYAAGVAAAALVDALVSGWQRRRQER